jgi:hypothetical protein
LTISLTTGLERNLSKKQWGVVQALSSLIEAERFRISQGSETERIDDRYARVGRCQGALVVAFPQWEARRTVRNERKTLFAPTEFVHVANVMAAATKKPMLVLREKSVAARGSLRSGYVHPTLEMPTDVDTSWLKTPKFKSAFAEWVKQVRAHRHVFLGYSTPARPSAILVRHYLQNQLKLEVLDWHDQARPGEVITQNIADAERVSMCGVFLFTADDLVKSGASRVSAPRDNVIYEAGFFAGAKGRANTLIIREKNTKVPTDLGGVIYLELASKTDIAPIETGLREYFTKVLPD